MSTNPRTAAGAVPAPKPALSAADRFRLLRNRLISAPAFRRIATAVPGLRSITNGRAEDLFAIVSGFVRSQLLFTLVEHGVLERIARQPCSTEEIAAGCGFRAERLEPLLVAARGMGLTARLDSGLWTTGDQGAVVASDPGLRAMIRHHHLLYADLADPAALLEGRSAETRLSGYWAYAGNRRDLARAGAVGGSTDPYSELMAQSQDMMAEEVLAAHSFAGCRSVLDVGGGDGVFLERAAARNPDMELACFDLPTVAARARIRLEAAGLGERARCHGGDFFRDPLPETEITTLIRIVCDHDDEDAIRLLANIRRRMRRGDRLLIAEAMRDGTSGGDLAATYFTLYFLAMGSGKCRSPAEIGRLLHAAGFTSYRFRRSRMPLLAGIIVAPA